MVIAAAFMGFMVTGTYALVVIGKALRVRAVLVRMNKVLDRY